jgi:hypothetical protein
MTNIPHKSRHCEARSNLCAAVMSDTHASHIDHFISIGEKNSRV